MHQDAEKWNYLFSSPWKTHNSKSLKYFNIILYSLYQFEEESRKYTLTGRDFQNSTLAKKEIRPTHDKCDFIILKSFCETNETLSMN